MKEALTSALMEGRAWLGIVYWGSTSFMLHITKSSAVILMLGKPLRSSLSLPSCSLFVLPVYLPWQKIICDPMLLSFHVSVSNALKEVISSFGSWAVFKPLFLECCVLESEHKLLLGLNFVFFFVLPLQFSIGHRTDISWTLTIELNEYFLA